MLPDALSYCSHLIEQETGIIFNDSNRFHLESRIAELLKQEGMRDIYQLIDNLRTNQSSALRQKFLDLATNNETLFFRDAYFFKGFIEYLTTHVLPKKPVELKIWSAACSTGQEAISIAIALDELSKTMTLPPWSIIGSDICSRAVDRAKKGHYTDFEMDRGLSPERRARYFKKEAQGWSINSEISSRITYRSNNLLRPVITDKFTFIFCRNVLIYQKVEQKAYIFRDLLRKLEPNGAVILGVGETMLGISDQVQSLVLGNVIFYQNRS